MAEDCGRSANDTLAAEAAKHWASDLQLSPLPGERDLNLRVSGSLDAVLKVMHPGCDADLVTLQIGLLNHLAGQAGLPVPGLIATRGGQEYVAVQDALGRDRLAWMIGHLPGQVLARSEPRSLPLIRQIGSVLGRMDKALKGFTHPALSRDLKWDLRQSDWILPHVDLIGDEARQTIVRDILDGFSRAQARFLKSLPVQAIHNDINDHNVLVGVDADGNGAVTGFIDFGDAQYAPVVAEVAIAGAYLMLDTSDPVESLAAFVEGYVAERPLGEDEVEAIWPLALTRLAVSVVNCALQKRDRPDDPYVTVSEAPAWRLLERSRGIDQSYVRARMRLAAGLGPDAGAKAVLEFLNARRGSFAPVMGVPLDGAAVIDISQTGAQAPSDPFSPDIAELTRRVHAVAGPEGVTLGRYAEPRLIYGTPAFFAGVHPAADRRTIHMAVDVFMPAGTLVHAPLAGTVRHATWYSDRLDYGGMVVLEHVEPASGTVFFTLYGHLSRASVDGLTKGQAIAEGEAFAALGAEAENGGWPPHVHFQLGLMPDGDFSWLGVVDPDQLGGWRLVFPNPAALLNLADDVVEAPARDVPALAAARQHRTASNLKLSYRKPVSVARGWRHYLFDDRGRCYLDAYNNVPHVGHAHPRVVAAVAEQMRMLSTNTRYLHPAIVDYAEALTARLPDPLDVCFFVNSGSEANEMAVRLARAYTGATDLVVSEHGYHGITNLCIDLSHYKFAGKGGGGQKDWVHLAAIPDTYRGKHKGPEAGAAYAADVGSLLERLADQGRRVAAFLSESFPSVGGQIIPPPGHLPAVYDHIRTHGGLAIADEVQTGLGRLGHHQWAFAQQGAVPDIVVLGKPIGNGYPLGAVVTTREIADAFATGMEYFSTFGGSTVSCVAGREVLRVLDDERLADNAAKVGAHLLAGLKDLASEHPIIGDVRGLGLFLGVELTEPDGMPGTAATGYIVNRLREKRILIGSDGPDDNVLKIRPPLCFGLQDADYLLDHLAAILSETPLRH